MVAVIKNNFSCACLSRKKLWNILFVYLFPGIDLQTNLGFRQRQFIFYSKSYSEIVTEMVFKFLKINGSVFLETAEHTFVVNQKTLQGMVAKTSLNTSLKLYGKMMQ